jgi:putative ABC transport system permease protein
MFLHTPHFFSEKLNLRFMFWNYIKIAWRNLGRRKLFATVNILGLTTGLTCVAFLYLCVQQMLSRDKHHERLSSLFLVQTNKDARQTVFPLLDVMLKDFPQVANGTRVSEWDAPWISYMNKEINERVTYVDTGFFNVFTFPLKYGNAATALKSKSGIVLSSETAAKLFGNENPLGKAISFSDKRQYIVTGVLQPVPPNASIRPAVLVSNQYLKDDPSFKDIADWYNQFTTTYVMLRPGADIARVEQLMKGIVATRYAEGGKDRVLGLLPYEMFAKKYGALNFNFYVYGLTCVAVFILLLVTINLVNLNMAVSFTRVQEVGVRKVLGSDRKAILFQFFTEVGLTVIISLVLAWAAACLLLPVMNQQMNGLQLTIPMLFSPPFIAMWLSAGVALVLIAGGYPAWYISALKLANTVKGKLHGSPQKAFSRQALIVVQFIIAVVFISGSLVMQRQLRYMKQSEVGFNKDQVLTVNLGLDFKDTAQARSGIDHLIEQLKHHTAVTGISTSQSVPGRFYENYNAYLPGGDANREVGMRQTYIDDGFLPAFGIRMLQGRNFSADMATDKKAAVINQTAMKALGWTSIEGKSLRSKGGTEAYPVIGVTSDYHYRSMEGQIEPLIHFFGGATRMQDGANYLSIRIRPAQAAPVITLLKKAFSGMPSHREFSYAFSDEVFNEQYQRIEGILTLINIFTLVCVLIACAGIFALVALAAQQRTREIGIRKVLGASIAGIVTLLSKGMIKLVGIAILLAGPLAWWIMNRWLQDFAYHISIPWWLLAAAGLVAILIALVTVSLQSVKAALMNPTKALRTE